MIKFYPGTKEISIYAETQEEQKRDGFRQFGLPIGSITTRYPINALVNTGQP